MMASLSVDLKQLSFKGEKWECQKIPSPQTERATSSLTNYFLNRPDVKAHILKEGKAIDFALVLGQKGPTLELKGATPHTFTLEGGKELKEVERFVRYHQNVGLLPRGVEGKEAAERLKTAEAATKVLMEPKLPENQAKMLSATRVGENAISLTRNILYSIPSIGTNNVVLDHTGYYVGGIWTAFSFMELADAKRERKKAEKIGDKEGVQRAKGRIAVGGMAATASISYMAGRIFDTFGIAAASMSAIASATVLFGFTSLFNVGRSGLGFRRTQHFNQKLNEYLENPHLTERDRLRGALRFLKDSVSVTEEERFEILDKIEREQPHLKGRDKENFFQEKLLERTEVKLNHMKRRTSGKALEAIVRQVETALQKIENGESLEEARALLKTVRSENRQKLVVYSVSMVAAMVSFAAMAMLSLFSLGTFPFVLYAASTAICLVMAIAGLIAQYRRPNHPQMVDTPVPSIA